MDAAASAPANRPPYRPIGLTVLTGFLGAGKTTLLNRLLRSPTLARSIVLVNEIGEIGIDHLIVKQLRENVVLLESGCLCCAVRDDMVHALRELFVQRLRGELDDFDRVVLETSGLADPVPIIHTLMSDPMLTERYRMEGLVTVIDAVAPPGQLDRHEEALRQAVVADSFVLSKLDLASPGQREAIEARLQALNPGAAILAGDAADAGTLLKARGYDPAARPAALREWLGAAAAQRPKYRLSARRPVAAHAADVKTYSFETARSLDWERLTDWLGALVAEDGEAILRTKGVLQIAGQAKPLIINGVRHVFYPPIELEAWPSLDRTSQLVLILRAPRPALLDRLEGFDLASLAADTEPARMRDGVLDRVS